MYLGCTGFAALQLEPLVGTCSDSFAAAEAACHLCSAAAAGGTHCYRDDQVSLFLDWGRSLPLTWLHLLLLACCLSRLFFWIRSTTDVAVPCSAQLNDHTGTISRFESVTAASTQSGLVCQESCRRLSVAL